jgi:hypothetical protein
MHDVQDPTMHYGARVMMGFVPLEILFGNVTLARQKVQPSKLLLLSEKQAESYDRAINEQTARNAHSHCSCRDLLAVRQNHR